MGKPPLHKHYKHEQGLVEKQTMYFELSMDWNVSTLHLCSFLLINNFIVYDRHINQLLRSDMRSSLLNLSKL